MKLNPHLDFGGDCAAAFAFYQSCLGGRIETMLTYGGSPIAGNVPEEKHSLIMHARLQVGDALITGADTLDAPQRPQGFRVALNFEDTGEARRIFDALSDGGEVRMPFSETFFSDGFGLVTDRFGTPWMIHCAQTSLREVTLVRTYDAPRALVWKLWTDPALLAKWWGPKEFTNPVCEIDLRPGGRMHIVMRAPDGFEHPMIGEFVEVKAPERLSFKATPTDADDKPLIDCLTIVSLEETGGQTKVTVVAQARGLAAIATQMIAGMNEGWSQSLDKLADLARSTKGKAA